jgi:hypothetical protein
MGTKPGTKPPWASPATAGSSSLRSTVSETESSRSVRFGDDARLVLPPLRAPHMGGLTRSISFSERTGQKNPTGSGWVLYEAHAINDAGEIVGSGTINGQEHAFLLTPVPEPSAFVLTSLGGLLLIGYGWFVRRRAI